MQSRITIVAFLCLTVFLCFFLCVMTGCGNQISGEENNTENMEITETENTEETTEWSVTHTELDRTLNKAVFYENSLFGATEEEDGIRITEYDLTDMDKKQDFFVDAIDNVSSISAKGNGSVVLLGQKGEGFAILEISDEGVVSETNDIQLEKMGLWPELKGVFFSDDGYCFIWYGMTVPCTEVFENGEEDVYTGVDRVYVLNEDMETVSYDEIPDSNGYRLISLLFDDKGHPILLAKDEEGYFEKTVRLSDEEDKEIVRLDLDSYNFDLTNCSNIIMAENGFAYISKGDICSFSTETGTEERLFHLSTAGLSETDIVSWQMNDGEIKIVDNYSGGENTEVTTIREGESDKTVLKIAVMSLDESTRNIISSFNRYSDTIQLEPVVYVKNYDYDGGIEKLRLDIIQGKAPDLFFEIGDEELAAKGAFVNLNDYIKKDGELTSDKIVSSVFEAYGSDDNLYVIAPTFIIHTMWGGQSTVGDISGVNLDELTGILEAKGKNINSIYGLATGDESALRALTSMEMDSFIDWNTATCNFECEEFYDLLRIVKSYEGADIGGSLYNAIHSGNVLFTFSTISSVENYCLQCEMYGEKVSFIGYPTDTGFGSAMNFIGAVSINSKSENKDAAWEFVKYYVINGGTTGFPVYVPRYEKMLSDSLEIQYYEDTYTSAQTKAVKAAYSEADGLRLEVYCADAEDVEVVRKLVEETGKKYEYETDIQLIIEEEAEAFLQGQKTEQEIAEIVQSRVSMYLAEKEQ